jgi:hypothetical protein
VEACVVLEVPAACWVVVETETVAAFEEVVEAA